MNYYNRLLLLLLLYYRRSFSVLVFFCRDTPVPVWFHVRFKRLANVVPHQWSPLHTNSVVTLGSFVEVSLYHVLPVVCSSRCLRMRRHFPKGGWGCSRRHVLPFPCFYCLGKRGRIVHPSSLPVPFPPSQSSFLKRRERLLVLLPPHPRQDPVRPRQN